MEKKTKIKGMRGAFKTPAIKFLLYYLLSLFFIFLLLRVFLYPYYIGKRFLSPFAFDDVKWYGIFIAISTLLGMLIVYKRRYIYQIDSEDIDRLVFYGVIAGLIGARIYYVIFQSNLYAKHPLQILFIWKGGLAIHGAVLSIILIGFLYTRKKKLSFLKVADLFSPALILGQAIGRWGNFINHEAFGYPTSLPWKMFVPMTFRPIQFKRYAFFHPAFLYESIGDLAIFYFLLYREKQGRTRDGEVFFTYLLLYSILRFFVEGLRTDSLMVGNIRIAQFISLVLIIISSYFLFIKKEGDSKTASPH